MEDFRPTSDHSCPQEAYQELKLYKRLFLVIYLFQVIRPMAFSVVLHPAFLLAVLSLRASRSEGEGQEHEKGARKGAPSGALENG